LLQLTFGTNAFSFPLQVTSGSYLCVYHSICTGAASAVTVGTVTVSQGSLLQCWSATTGVEDAAIIAAGPSNGVSSQSLMIGFIVQVNAPGSVLCTVTMGAWTPPVTTATAWELFVTPYNSVMSL